MNNKIHVIDSSVSPAPLKAPYGPATAGFEYDKSSTVGMLEITPDSNGQRYFQPVLRKAGAPTNGTSGSGAGFMGPGSGYYDTTAKAFYVNTGSQASPVWIPEGTNIPTVTLLAGDGAVTKGTVNVVTKGSAAALTVAAPTAGAPGTGDDGVTIEVGSDTAFAHAITFTGSKLDTGSAAALTATFNAFKGASLVVRAYNGRWKVVAANGVSFS